MRASLLFQGELEAEEVDLKKLFSSARGIEVEPRRGRVEDEEGRMIDVSGYSFGVPASTFPGSPIPADVKVRFEASLDSIGNLRQMTIRSAKAGTALTITGKYEDADEGPPIEPPGPAEVHGPAQTVRTPEELTALLAPAPS